MSLLVEIYTKQKCNYSLRVKHFLNQDKVDYTEIDITDEPDLRDEMIVRTQGKTTVPQVFINDQYIGDHDEFMALRKSGQLGLLLAQDYQDNMASHTDIDGSDVKAWQKRRLHQARSLNM